MTTPLLVVIPTHNGDVDRTETLLKWVRELGEVREHSLLLATDSAIPVDRVKALLELVRGEFNYVKAMVVNTGAVGWPLAPNLMFRAVARQVQESYKLPWLWLEPDAVPLRAHWLDTLGEAYRKCPRPLMGCVLDAERAIDGLPNRYMAGVAVYPQDVFGLLATRWTDAKFAGMAKPPKMATAQFQRDVRAFDMVFANDLVPRAMHTPLIQHFWGTDYGTPPVFKTARTEADPVNAVTLDLVRKDAVLFHRVKDVEGFLAMWRVRLEGEKALVVEAVRQRGEPSRDVEKALETGKRKVASARQPELASV